MREQKRITDEAEKWQSQISGQERKRLQSTIFDIQPGGGKNTIREGANRGAKGEGTIENTRKEGSTTQRRKVRSTEEDEEGATNGRGRGSNELLEPIRQERLIRSNPWITRMQRQTEKRKEGCNMEQNNTRFLYFPLPNNVLYTLLFDNKQRTEI